MPWQLGVALYILFSSTRAIQSRRLGLLKRDLTLYALSASFISVFLVGLTYALLTWSRIDHSAAWDAKGYLVLGGALFGVLNLLILKLYRYVPASVAVFMNLFNTISVLAVAAFFADEILSSRQWIGAVVLLSAVIGIGLASRQSKVSSAKKRSITIGIILSLCAAALFGPGIVNESYLIQRIGVETYMLYGWGLQAFWALLLAFSLRDRSGKKKMPMTKSMHKNVWLYGVLLGIAGMFFVLSLDNSGSASITAVSATARIAAIVVMAYIFLNERDNVQSKLVGLLVSAIGLYLLFT